MSPACQEAERIYDQVFLPQLMAVEAAELPTTPETAKQAFEERKQLAQTSQRTYSSALYAGSPMIGYCKACGGPAGKVAESNPAGQSAVPEQCRLCKDGIAKGFLTGEVLARIIK
jgi:hypothetical protein